MSAKAVIFDFDGVIADSERYHLAAFNQVFAEFGFKLDDKVYYSTYLGFTDFELLEDVRRDYKIDYKGRSIEQISVQKMVFFHKLISGGGCLIDGVVEFVAELKKHNIRFAINSGSILADIRAMLKGSKIENTFEVIVSADDIEKGKPDPEGYLLALERLNKNSTNPIAPDQCIVIEDSRWGIMSAQKAGMHIIGITSSYQAKELVGTDLIIDSFRQLKITDLHKLCS